MSKHIPVIDMKKKESGKIVLFDGGTGMVNKLEKLGLIIGTKIVKVSQQLMGGPVVIKIGNTQIGMGFQTAKKIIVEVSR